MKMNNKTFSEKAIRHGEILIVPVDAIPENAVEIYNGSEYIIGHSETGHHHVAVGTLTVYRPVGADDGSLFLRVNEDSRVEHRKSFDQHETKTLFKGIYQVTVKRAYDYFEKVMRRVED